MSEEAETIDLRRRHLLVGLAAGAGASLAGCAGLESSAQAAATAAQGASGGGDAARIPSGFRRLAGQLADPPAAVSKGEAWIEFCESLKPLARLVTGPESFGERQNQTEGLRCLARLVALGFDRFLENGDPRHPAFYDLQTPTRKYLGDNPDQTYRGVTIDGTGVFRVRGSTAGAAGVEIGLYAGGFRSDSGEPGGGRRLVDSLDERNLSVDPDGNFELVVAPEGVSTEQAANRLVSDVDTNTLLIRTYFWDRDRRLAHSFPGIERLDVADPRPPLDPTSLIRGLLATTAFVEGSMEWWRRFDLGRDRLNELFVMPDDGSVQTPSRVRYMNGMIRLDPDEAFVVEFMPMAEPDYWSWVLQNVWGETPDWRDRPVVKNNRELVREDDGRIRIVVAEADPGIANWLDMAGHRQALLSLRWRGESALPSVATAVVKTASLGA
ncbi:MAG TPA: DUF1214 domain-containing protein [Deltaproteobacteria bacterium]|nr:DUF1214 domain-containing protein [Deltaproteobacteria bacterium]